MNAPTNELSTTPLTVPGVSAVAVAAGGSHVCVLRPDGTVGCWGSNSSGQLGNGTTTRSRALVDVVGL